jgi:putative membrane protein
VGRSGAVDLVAASVVVAAFREAVAALVAVVPPADGEWTFVMKLHQFWRRMGLAPLFTQAQLEAIATAIAEVEKNTDAELVAVFARRADNYFHASLLWAALAALLTPMALRFTPLWLDADDLLVAQWMVFVVLALLLSIPEIRPRLVPRSTQRWYAENLARRQFLANNLHHTRGETGVLIFIAEAEHWMEILPDRGISRYIADDRWQAMVDRCIAQIKTGRAFEGMLQCIQDGGELLACHVPVTSQKNELPNRLVVLK